MTTPELDAIRGRRAAAKRFEGGIKAGSGAHMDALLKLAPDVDDLFSALDVVEQERDAALKRYGRMRAAIVAALASSSLMGRGIERLAAALDEEEG